jgi:hypothetical protein
VRSQLLAAGRERPWLTALFFDGGGYESYHFISDLTVSADRVSRSFVHQIFKLRWPATIDSGHFGI